MEGSQVRWRGWFPNDTDLLSPWIKRDYAAHWDRVLETMLRLKLNLLDMGEFSDESLRKLRVPRDRGLAVTTTHLAPLGASLRDWADYWKKQGRTTPPPLRTAALTAPVTFPATTPLAGRATVTGLPAAWANPALGPTAQFTAGAFSGEATFTLDPADRTLRLAATRPAEFGPVTVTSPRLPALPPFTLRLTPRLTASPARVTFTCDDLTLTSPGGDRITVNLSAAHDLATATTHATSGSSTADAASQSKIFIDAQTKVKTNIIESPPAGRRICVTKPSCSK